MVGRHRTRGHQGISRSLLRRRALVAAVRSNFSQMMRKAVHNGLAHGAAQSISSVTAKNIGQTPRQNSGNASTAALQEPTSLSASLYMRMVRFVGSMLASVALVVASWAVSGDGR